ncbi:hypothetical protein FKM82_020320 [Ascaphus truei]
MLPLSILLPGTQIWLGGGNFEFGDRALRKCLICKNAKMGKWGAVSLFLSSWKDRASLFSRSSATVLICRS